MEKYYLQLYRHTLSAGEDDVWIDLDSLELHPEMAQLLADFGILDIKEGHIKLKHAVRLARLRRLRCALGLNLNAAAIILDLLERIESLQEELNHLRGN